MKTIEKLHRRSAGCRPPRPNDHRRLYRAGRESKAWPLPPKQSNGDTWVIFEGEADEFDPAEAEAVDA